MARRVSSPVLVGRDAELSAAADVLQAALDGQGQLLLIGGDAGIGKSRLLGEIVALAVGIGFTATVGHCVDLGEGVPPFAPIADAVRGLRRSLGDAAITEALGAAATDLGPLLPGSSTGHDRSSQPNPARVFEAILELLEGLSETTPVLLAIEDAHWADQSTRDLLAYLSRALAGRVVVAVTFRSDELHRRHPLRPLVADLERQSRTARLDLRPLVRAELVDQLTAIQGAPPGADLVEEIWVRSEGNPFYAEELLLADESCERMPASVREATLARVDALPDEHQVILRLAAAVGREVDDGLLRELAERPVDDVDRVVRDLVGASLLVPAGEGYRFRHALLQEVVYDELLPGERTRLHVCIAEHLESDDARRAGGASGLTGARGPAESSPPRTGLHRSDPAESSPPRTGLHRSDPAERARVAAERAHHWWRARRSPEALAAAVAAAVSAEAVGAPADALAYYERALELWDSVPDAAERSPLTKAELLDRAMVSVMNAGLFDRGIALYRDAIANLDHEAEPVRAGLLHLGLAKCYFSADRPGAMAEFEQSVALVPAAPQSAARATVLAGQAQAFMLTGRVLEARDIATQAIEVAQAVGARQVEGHARNTRGTAMTALGHGDVGRHELTTSLAIAHEVGEPHDIGRAHVNYTQVLADLGEWDELVAHGQEALEVTRRYGLDRTHGVYVEVNMVEGLIALGRWDDAVAGLRAMVGRRPGGHWDYFGVGPLDADRGDFDAVRAELARAGQLPEHDTAVLQGLTSYVHAQVALAIWEGRPGEARALVDEVLHRLPPGMVAWQSAPLLWRATWSEADLGEIARARQDTVAHAAAATAADRRLELLGQILGRAGDGRGLLGADGLRPQRGAEEYERLATAERSRLDGADTAEQWLSAAGGFDAVGIVYPAAYARYRAADALVRAGDRAAAADLTRTAAGVARSLGAKPLLALIEQLVVRGRLAPGASGEAADPTDDGLGLSTREREVLVLVAAGRTNREIAQHLYISPKTASVHVSNILSKLGVSGRVEAAAIAHRLGLTN